MAQNDVFEVTCSVILGIPVDSDVHFCYDIYMV